MPTGRDIMEKAGVLLNDVAHVRWPLKELADWINDSVHAIILAKPSASSESRIISLVPGTRQAVPQDGNPTALSLISIVRNIRDIDAPHLGGRAIRTTSQAMLDVQDPNWHDGKYTRFQREVRQFVFDERAPLQFYVYPGNDGNGAIEAVVATSPKPLIAAGDPTVIASWTGSIGLPEPYSVPILDYVLYRAQSKDDLTGNGGRATMHYQQFATAIGLKIQVEGAHSPRAR